MTPKAAVLIILMTISQSLESRILFLFPTPSKSHMIIVHALSTALAERGHNVTVLSPFPLSKTVKNHHEILLPLSDGVRRTMHQLIRKSSHSYFTMILDSKEMAYELADNVMSSEVLNEILDEKFDLLVVGMVFTNFLLGFGEYFDCPVIMLSVQRHMSPTNFIVGNPLSVSSVPHSYVGRSEMDFVDRVRNFLFYGVDFVFYEYLNYHQEAIYNKYFSSPPNRSFEDAVRNISLIFVNDHFIEGKVRPNVPAVIEIRGIHIKSVPDKLPNKIEKFLNAATRGAIYFSLGSNISSEFLPEDVFKIIISVFSKLSKQVIMKWDSKNINSQSSNILIEKWLPQSDILAHSNVKLFISHCGLGSVVESKYHGVPILCLPMFGDQMMNADACVEEGWGVKMELKSLKEIEFLKKINELIQNETYSSKAKSFSRLYHDRPLSPKETAVYWTEYVINHRGAKHLQYKAIHQNYWQRNSLDVIGFLLFCLWITVKSLGYTLRCINKLINNRYFNKGSKSD
ncbi:UDP-glycosyltransferase UGT5-like [Chironomus tepperi]|uniref:UDP-glycosyltransferase UGT5-like n=1 Tax=Chironomus tepperi TaxID=113505 RepID=UPI00391F42AD